jgi:hypothetical protein
MAFIVRAADKVADFAMPLRNFLLNAAMSNLQRLGNCALDRGIA